MGQRGPPPLGTKSLILFVNLQNIRKIKTIRVLPPPPPPMNSGSATAVSSFSDSLYSLNEILNLKINWTKFP